MKLRTCTAPLRALRSLLAPRVRTKSDALDLDDYSVDEARAIVASFGSDRYGYAVTANVDHAIRHYYDAQFRHLYADATYVLLDSRFLAHLVGLLKRQHLRVCPGSDLTTAVFRSVIKPNDVAVLVGGTAAQAQELRTRFGLNALRHVDPPVKFIRDAAAVEACLREVEALSPFRFCFLAIGSPQQEIIANKLQERGIARGFALCVGASIDYMTGAERRAPHWVQMSGFEWSYRLLQNPRRMANRYLVRGPRIFMLLSRIELRPRRPITVPHELLPSTFASPPVAVTGEPVQVL
jgi:exopolysaccharide biosynthesis WecB/TagA/CpsF family protein